MTEQRIGVVFVHGFLSSAATWSSFLRLLREDDDLAGFAMHPFQYATPLVSLHPLRRIPNLNNIADSLRTYLTYDLAHYDKLVLVSHSQGGLVVQRLLARTLADGRGRDLARIRRIVMFACPNSGSDLALLLRRRAWLFWRHPQERELRPLNEAITDTHRTVLKQVIHATSVTASTCPIPIAAYAGETDGVVTPASAKSVFPDVGVLPGDHFSIIRPRTRTDRSYTIMKSHLRDLRHDPVPAPEAKEVPSPRRSSGPVQSPAARHTHLVDTLLAVPRMSEPGFRQQLYDLLPPVIVQQLRRDPAARIELFNLVTSFEHYRHLAPWEALAAAMSSLVPGHPAVNDVLTAAADCGLLAPETER